MEFLERNVSQGKIINVLGLTSFATNQTGHNVVCRSILKIFTSIKDFPVTQQVEFILIKALNEK